MWITLEKDEKFYPFPRIIRLETDKITREIILKELI